MDARRAPHRILSFHAADQVSDLFRHLRTPYSLPAGSPCPEQAVSGAMPRDYRIGLDENECFGPVGPDPRNDHSEQAIDWIQLGARLFAFVHGKLLSKSDRLHCQTPPRDQERPTYASVANRAVIITPMLIAFGMIPKLLIREAACVLMTDGP